MLAEVDAESLVLCADEDGGNKVAGYEEEQKAVMEPGVADGVEDGKKNQATCTRDGEDNG